MEGIDEFLKRTECHFNWNLTAIDVSDLSWVEKFREKIEENRSLDYPSELIWPLKLTYSFELLATDEDGSAKVVDEVIEEIEGAVDGLTCKYRTSFQHIAYAFKVFVQVKSHRGYQVEVTSLIQRIKPISEMSPIEKSAVLAMQAQVLRYYGPNGTFRCVPLQREAIRLNPEEIEFKLSLVVSMNRKRHYDINLRSQMTWSTVEEPVSILEQLLNHPNLTPEQRVSCEYFLAVAYHDFLASTKKYSPEYKECKIQILKSCNWIHDKTDHPQIMSFCADRFFHLENDKPKGLRVIEAALKRFAHHVGVNTTASKLYEGINNLNLAAKHAQIALDGGGFGAAWLLLGQKTKLNQEFDDEEYFDNILQLFPQRYKKQIHLSACIYYLQSKHDVVKGARHMEMALIEDPSYYSLSSVYSSWVSRTVRPLELTYGMIIRELNLSSHSKEDLATLRSAKSKIEEVADVDSFNLTQNYASSFRGKGSDRRGGYPQSSRNRRGTFNSHPGDSNRGGGGTNWRNDDRSSNTKVSTSADAEAFHQWTSGATSADANYSSTFRARGAATRLDNLRRAFSRENTKTEELAALGGNPYTSRDGGGTFNSRTGASNRSVHQLEPALCGTNWRDDDRSKISTSANAKGFQGWSTGAKSADASMRSTSGARGAASNSDNNRRAFSREANSSFGRGVNNRGGGGITGRGRDKNSS